jgi:hypothetical protein
MPKLEIGKTKGFYTTRKRLTSKRCRGSSRRKTRCLTQARVPKKYEGQTRRRHSDLYTDEKAQGTVHGLRFRSRLEARKSVKRVLSLERSGKITHKHAIQIGLAMEQRSRYHHSKTPGIRAGNKVWKEYLRKHSRGKRFS